MKAKKTVAILGLEKGEANPFIDKLACDHRLLIVSKDIKNCAGISEYISQNKPEHEVEVIDCAKEGCWEADLIILWNVFQFEEDELLRLREVATQKIILLVKDQERDNTDLPLFPNSKVVTLVLNPLTTKANVYGKDLEAVDLIYKFINKKQGI